MDTDRDPSVVEESLMASGLQIALDEGTAREVQEIAAALHRSVDDVASEAVRSGVHLLRRWTYLNEQSKSVDSEAVIAKLRMRRSDRPLETGEELPDDLK